MARTSKQAVELTISQEMKTFLREHIGEQPKTVQTRIVDDVIIVRFTGVSPPAERQYSRLSEGAQTMRKLKERIFAGARPFLEAVIKKITTVDVIDVYSSFDVKTDERIEIFTLAKVLDCNTSVS